MTPADFNAYRAELEARATAAQDGTAPGPTPGLDGVSDTPKVPEEDLCNGCECQTTGFAEGFEDGWITAWQMATGCSPEEADMEFDEFLATNSDADPSDPRA